MKIFQNLPFKSLIFMKKQRQRNTTNLHRLRKYEKILMN